MLQSWLISPCWEAISFLKTRDHGKTSCPVENSRLECGNMGARIHFDWVLLYYFHGEIYKVQRQCGSRLASFILKLLFEILSGSRGSKQINIFTNSLVNQPWNITNSIYNEVFVFKSLKSCYVDYTVSMANTRQASTNQSNYIHVYFIVFLTKLWYL